MNGNGDRCSAVERCSLPLWVWQSAFVCSSAVAGPMSNAGGVPEFLRWGHGGPLGESWVASCAFGLDRPAIHLQAVESVAWVSGQSFSVLTVPARGSDPLFWSTAFGGISALKV